MVVEVYQSDIESLRLLLMGSGILLLVWWIAQLRAERPDKPKAPTSAPAFCKLHQRPENLCRDMHDPGA